MYPTSQNYKNAITSLKRTDRMAGAITFRGGATANILDLVSYRSKFSVEHNVVESGFEIGTFYSRVLKCELTDGIIRSYAGAVVTPSYEIQLGDGAWEGVPLGAFNVNSGSVKRIGSVVRFTAYDNSIKFDRNIRDLAGGATKSIYAWLVECCTSASVALVNTQSNISSLPNGGEEIRIVDQQIQTLRDVVQWIAQILGCYAIITRDGKLQLKQLPTSVTRIITADERKYIQNSDNSTYLKYVNSTYEGEAFSTLTGGEGAIAAKLDLPENPILKSLTRTQAERITQKIADYLKDFKFRSAKVNFIGDPSIDVLDLVEYPTGDGAVQSIICNSLWQYRTQHILQSTAPSMFGDTSDMDTKSQTDKRIDGLDGKKPGIGVKVAYSNNVPIGQSVRELTRVSFGTDDRAYAPHITMAKWQMSTAGTVEFKLYVDSNLVETWREFHEIGEHHRSLSYPLIVNNGGHVAVVTISSADGIGSFAEGQSNSYVFSADITATSPWDGTISAEEVMPLIHAISTLARVQPITDSVAVKMYSPINRIISELMAKITVENTPVNIKAVEVVQEFPLNPTSGELDLDLQIARINIANPVDVVAGSQIDLSQFTAIGYISGASYPLNIMAVSVDDNAMDIMPADPDLQLLTNTDFKEGTAGWSANSGATRAVIADVEMGNILKVMPNITDWASGVFQRVPEYNEGDYTLGVWLKADAPRTLGIGFNAHDKRELVELTTEWQYYTITANGLEGGANALVFYSSRQYPPLPDSTPFYIAYPSLYNISNPVVDLADYDTVTVSYNGDGNLIGKYGGDVPPFTVRDLSLPMQLMG